MEYCKWNCSCDVCLSLEEDEIWSKDRLLQEDMDEIEEFKAAAKAAGILK